MQIASCAGFLFFALMTSAGVQAQNNRPVARLITATPRAPQRVAANYSHTVARRTSTPTTTTRTVVVAATSEERRTFELINAARRRNGLQPLVLDAELSRMARLHSEQMASSSFLSHAGLDGLEAPDRARALGITGWRALGENVAYNQGFNDPAAFAVERWMISEKHRENITNRMFTHTGLGVARTADGRVFFTQVFMSR
jgi:uncharacterized protein YkwD